MFSKTFSALLFTGLAVSVSPARQITPAAYYDPDGGVGACGNALQSSDFIVALGEGNWDGGAHCGQTLMLKFIPSAAGQGNTLRVGMQGFFPRCWGADGIDLSEGAMAALDPNYMNDGVISVVWSFA
ncbi:hypothetical protein C8R45DRAFT_931221 [Mycena sanguinolenta]|nr:hypothetical protein C8R45DRAFT_931221 [Mycena sanguinolenta]